MSDQSQQDAQQAAPDRGRGKRLLPPSRVALLIFVGLSLVVIIMELRARRDCGNTFDAIDKARSETDALVPDLSREAVRKLLQGDPVQEAESDDGQVFTWNGALRSYRIHVSYGDDGLMIRMRTDSAFRWSSS